MGFDLANRPEPWANKSIVPFQAAGAYLPLVERDGELEPDRENHGTVCFLSAQGLFVTAGHVVEHFNDDAVVTILNGLGMPYMRVKFVLRHPVADLAIGFVEVDPNHSTKISPMTLSRRRLAIDAHVAVLGYPRTKLGERAGVGTTLQFNPDYYPGDVFDFCPDGVTLTKGPTYLVNMMQPPSFADYSGLSGGPVVDPETLEVHAVFSTWLDGENGYATCPDIATLLDWEMFAPYLYVVKVA